jgi:gluconate 2-dehydrogenase alpha chain
VADKAIVVGSGAGGSTAAMVLAEAGWDVVIFEKGRNYFGDLTSPTPATPFSNDELKASYRAFEEPDAEELEPRTYRRSPADEDPFHVGNVNHLPMTVGGGTTHWDAKTPRFWTIDFAKLTLLGPVDGADIVDWPFTYDDIAPNYDEVEALIGVAGDVSRLPADITLKYAPRTKPLPMPFGPPQYSSLLEAAGAEAIGLHPFPVPMAINSVPYDGRPACNNCGFCSHYGCPIHARVGALAPLRRALLAGAELRPEAFVSRVDRNGSKATGVTWLDSAGKEHTEKADLVVLAANAIESARLARISELPDPHDVLGRYLMMHWFTAGFAIFVNERVHAWRGRSTTHAADDFADPEFPGARAFAQANGLPYIRAGVLELGGTQDPIAEAKTYQGLLPILSPAKPFGAAFKQLMRASLLRDRLAGVQMIAEDLPYRTNAVDLDPKVKDYRGFPVARITFAPGPHELVTQRFYIPLLTAMLKASGADVAAAVPETSSDVFPVAAGDVPGGAHVIGGLRMAVDPKLGATDAWGRIHTMDNVVVADGAVFSSAGGHNPTLTIMATALRNARHWASASGAGESRGQPTRLPATGDGSNALAAGLAAGAAAVAAAAAGRAGGAATRRPRT